jgi:hypothetical protein
MTTYHHSLEAEGKQNKHASAIIRDIERKKPTTYFYQSFNHEAYENKYSSKINDLFDNVELKYHELILKRKKPTTYSINHEAYEIN